MKIFRKKTVIPPEFIEHYQNDLLFLQTQAARVLALAAFFVFPLFGFVADLLFAPHKYTYFLVIRCICAIIFLGIHFYLSKKSAHRYSEFISFCILILMGWTINVMIRELGYDSPYYTGLNIVYLCFAFVPTTALKTALGCLSIYIFYILPILLFDLRNGVETKVFIGNNQFQIVTIVAVVIANYIKFSIFSSQIIYRLTSRLTIARQAKELEERDKYKREFIANITHELKTPLSIVIGNVDLIMGMLGEQQPKIMEQAQQVQQAAFQLASHVDRIIAVSNIDDPMVKLDLQNCNYCGVAQNLFSLFVPKAREEKITYTLNCPEKPLVVNVDIVRIEEALTNLIQNAFKFTNEGGTITVTVATDGQQVVTEVADTGVGIPEDKQANLFDRMFQADDVLSKRHGGMGLGLYIVKKNIEMHGGIVEVDSREKKGTSFRFTLPLHIDQTIPVKNEPYRGEEGRQTQPHRMFEYQRSMSLDKLARMSFAGDIDMFENMNPSQATILVIEDNPGMMKVVIESLRHEYNLLLGRDAFEALDKLNKYSDKVSLILSDIMMPGMNGFDFCGKVMENSEWKRIPLIFVTALMSEEDQLKGFGLGATDYITKPYNMKILKGKVDHWISRRQYETILRNMSRELETRVQQISRVKDIILHEIRNPTSAISAAVHLIARVKGKNGEGMDDPKIDNYLNSLRQGVESLNSVLETTCRLDIDTMATCKPESVESIVREALSQTRHLIGTIRLTMEMNHTADVLVKADRRMLVQVLINIIRNAVEAIGEKDPAEGGIITISCAMSDNNQVALKISDNGIGMDEAVSKNLFRFKYTTKRDGTGIGLYLSNMMVRMHEGTLRVDSTKGSGSNFTMVLPAC